MGETIAFELGSVNTLSDGITSVGGFVFDSFNSLIGSIAQEPIFLWPIIFAAVSGTIGLMIKLIRKFGLKGRR